MNFPGGSPLSVFPHRTFSHEHDFSCVLPIFLLDCLFLIAVQGFSVFSGYYCFVEHMLFTYLLAFKDCHFILLGEEKYSF